MSTHTHLQLVPDLDPDPGDPMSASDPGLIALREELAELRESVFSLGDCSRRALGGGHPSLQVALQAAAHHLSEAERLLRQAN